MQCPRNCSPCPNRGSIAKRQNIHHAISWKHQSSTDKVQLRPELSVSAAWVKLEEPHKTVYKLKTAVIDTELLICTTLVLFSSTAQALTESWERSWALKTEPVAISAKRTAASLSALCHMAVSLGSRLSQFERARLVQWQEAIAAEDFRCCMMHQLKPRKSNWKHLKYVETHEYGAQMSVFSHLARHVFSASCRILVQIFISWYHGS